MQYNKDNSVFRRKKYEKQKLSTSSPPPPPTVNKVSAKHQFRKKRGFTLAETLITLAIIGIIAALTIPNLLRNYQRAELETGFKKAYNDLSKAVGAMVAEYGDDMVNPEIQNKSNDGNQRAKIFLDEFTDKYMGGHATNTRFTWGPTTNTYKYYNGQPSQNGGCPQFETTLNGGRLLVLRNQCFIASTLFNGVSIGNFLIDINGVNRGPNRWGYDLFAFVIDKNKKILVPDGATGAYYGHDRPFKCGSKGTSKFSHDYGCSYYAIINRCPEDDSKTYWECLKL